MAAILPIQEITKPMLTALNKELTIYPKRTHYDPNPKPVCAYDLDELTKQVYIPLRLADKYKATVGANPKADFRFVYTLYTKETDPKKSRDQTAVAEEAIKKLDLFRSVLIACFTSFGKTMMATYLSAHYKQKTVILCHLNEVKRQFIEEIIKFTGGTAKVQYVKGKKPLDPKADIYVMGIRKATLMKREELSNSGIATVIIDELHMSTQAALTKAVMMFTTAERIIGLSATPDQGFENLIYAHFGKPEEWIVRKETKPFTVIRRWTNFEPTIEYMVAKGQVTVKWTEVLSSIGRNEAYWQDIVDVVTREEFKNEKIIVLCDRKVLARGVYFLLTELGESAELFIGGSNDRDETKRILVAGTKKGSVGMNDPNLTMLVLAADMRDVRQAEGRIRTVNNIVLDYRHNYDTLDKHGKLRDKWYTARGAVFTDEGPRPPNMGKPKVPQQRLLGTNVVPLFQPITQHPRATSKPGITTKKK